ncbi:MAG: nodulation protein NfeD [Actinobacteria bacterium]|nr:MAG: nodulation protein NfeD [Actinomycetota bacterium]TML66121.1 MAG: nodulation protein NfeD [Actinomycetota bacterium]
MSPATKMTVRRVGSFAILVLAAGALGLGATGTTTAGATASRAKDARPVVYQVSITGGVDPATARLVERGVRQAQNAKADALLVRVDTPGGLISSMEDIVKAIQGSSVPAVCWVGPRGSIAGSAATFIVIGCPVAAMAPSTSIGAAHPVGVSGATEITKVTNFYAGYIRSLAESYGRNAKWAENAVRHSVSASAKEALRLHVVDLIAPSTPALFRALDGRQVGTAAGSSTLHLVGARVNEVHLTSGEEIVHWLSDADLAFLLFVFGIGGIVFEIFHPGLNVPGLVGIVLVILSFVVFDSLPINVAGAILLVLAFVLFVIDIKVAAHGLPTIGGIVLFILGGLLLYDPSSSDEVSRPLLISIGVLFAAFFFVVVRAAMRARRAPVVSGVERLIGQRATVVDDLDPVGRVRIEGETWTARAVGEPPAPVPAGATVEIRERQGFTLIVEPIDQLELGLTDSSINSEARR